MRRGRYRGERRALAVEKADALQILPRLEEAIALLRAVTPAERETVIGEMQYLTPEQARAILSRPRLDELMAVRKNLTDYATGAKNRNAVSVVKSMQLWLSYFVGLPVQRVDKRVQQTTRVVLEYGRGEAVDVTRDGPEPIDGAVELLPQAVGR